MEIPASRVGRFQPTALRPSLPSSRRVRFRPIDDRVAGLRAGVCWLAAEARHFGLDAVIVASKRISLADLRGAFGDETGVALLARQFVPFAGQHLQLISVDEVWPEARRHRVALALQLDDRELAIVNRMNAAALCAVPASDAAIRRWIA